MLRRFLLSTAILLCATAAQAITIVSVTGPNSAGSTSASYLSGEIHSVGFSTAAEYTNVSISVYLVTFGPAVNVTLNAFLTDQVGTGTTAAANEIASSTQQITVPAASPGFPYAFTEVTVLSGLNLTAGTYYLTLVEPGHFVDLAWMVTLNANLTTTLDSGAAMVAGYLWTTLSPPPYAPASQFNTFGAGLWFQVTGDPATVPEPASLTLFAGCIALACVYGRRRN